MFKKVIVNFRSGEPLEIDNCEEVPAPSGIVRFKSYDGTVRYEVVGENVNYIQRIR